MAEVVVTEATAMGTPTLRLWARLPVQHTSLLDDACFRVRYSHFRFVFKAVVNALVIIAFFTVMTFVIVLLYKVSFFPLTVRHIYQAHNFVSN